MAHLFLLCILAEKMQKQLRRVIPFVLCPDLYVDHAFSSLRVCVQSARRATAAHTDGVRCPP